VTSILHQIRAHHTMHHAVAFYRHITVHVILGNIQYQRVSQYHTRADVIIHAMATKIVVVIRQNIIINVHANLNTIYNVMLATASLITVHHLMH